MSDYFKTPNDLRDFEKFLAHTNRFHLTLQWKNFTQGVAESAAKREIILKKGSVLFRARNGSDLGEGHWRQPVPIPFSLDKMGMPPEKITKDGRVNPRGIPYLYLANSLATVLSEIRPFIGELATVAKFKTKEKLKLVDTTGAGRLVSSNKKKQDFEKCIWRDISFSFSKPATRDNEYFDYLSAQFLGELFKQMKFDGVLYRSSLHPQGKNILLFNQNGIEPIKSSLYRITGLKYQYRSAI